MMNDHHRAPNRIRAAGVALLALLLLAGCTLPVTGSHGAAQPATDPPAPTSPAPIPSAPAPPTPPPTATPPEPPAPPLKATLPQVAAGEPSLLVARGERTCGLVALTYDAGSGADGAAAVLDVLKKHGVSSTFFLTGKWVERYPELAKRITAEGHEVGNHSYSHPDLTTIPDDEVLQQIKDGEAAILKATGQDPRPLFREPYGAFNEHQRRLVRQAGYSFSIYWDVDTLDWQFPPVETLVTRIMRAGSGSIVLMHMNVVDTALASDLAIPQLVGKGLRPVTVSELLHCKTPE